MSKEHFSDRIRGHEVPADAGAWEAMEAMLDGKAAKPGARGSWRKYLGLILLLIVLSGAGLYGLGVLNFSPEKGPDQKKQENKSALADQVEPAADAEVTTSDEAMPESTKPGEKQEGEAVDPRTDRDLSTQNANSKADQSANMTGPSNGTDAPSDAREPDAALPEGTRPMQSDQLDQHSGAANMEGQSKQGLNGKSEEQTIDVVNNRNLRPEEKAEWDVNSSDRMNTKSHPTEDMDGESESVKRISSGKNRAQSVDQTGLSPMLEEGVDENVSDESGVEGREAGSTIAKKREVQSIDPSENSGIGGDIPSGFTTVRMDGYESRLAGVPQPEVSVPGTTFSITRVSFFGGYTDSASEFGLLLNRGLTGGRFIVGVSYLLSERLRLETEYGNTTLSFISAVSNGQKNEKMSFRGQHVHLKYTLTGNDFGELRLYGGGGFGKYVYDSFVNTQAGPFAPPIEIVNDTSNLLSLDFGLAGLCTWSDIWVETRFGIMYNQAFEGGGLIFNYGATVYFNPWKNRE